MVSSSRPVPKSISTSRALVGHHHVLRLDVAVDESGRVHGRHRARRGPRRCGWRPLGVNAAPSTSGCSSVRPLTNSIHRPTSPSGALGAVDGDDVRMADAGEQASFFDDGVPTRRLRRFGRQQLQRDVAIEPRVPRAVDVAERAAADALEHAEVTPRALA